MPFAPAQPWKMRTAARRDALPTGTATRGAGSTPALAQRSATAPAKPTVRQYAATRLQPQTAPRRA